MLDIIVQIFKQSKNLLGENSSLIAGLTFTRSSSLGTLVTALTKLPLLGSTFVSVSKVLFDNPLPAISWNHSKIVAVNGKTAMTGGGNCWIYYTATDKRSNSIVDHQAKIKGGAAVSAHMYADYFWKYVETFDRFSEGLSSLMEFD
jgi:hypothetical protein